MEKEGQSDVQGEHQQAGDLVKGLEAALQCVQVQDIAECWAQLLEFLLLVREDPPLCGEISHFKLLV